MNMILPVCGESFIFPRTVGRMSSRIAGATSPAVHFELPRFTLTPNLPRSPKSFDRNTYYRTFLPASRPCPPQTSWVRQIGSVIANRDRQSSSRKVCARKEAHCRTIPPSVPLKRSLRRAARDPSSSPLQLPWASSFFLLVPTLVVAVFEATSQSMFFRPAADFV